MTPEKDFSKTLKHLKTAIKQIEKGEKANLASVGSSLINVNEALQSTLDNYVATRKTYKDEKAGFEADIVRSYKAMETLKKQNAACEKQLGKLLREAAKKKHPKNETLVKQISELEDCFSRVDDAVALSVRVWEAFNKKYGCDVLEGWL